MSNLVTAADPGKIALFITRERGALLDAWRNDVRQFSGAHGLDIPALNDHMPDFLGELALLLHGRSSEQTQTVLADGSPGMHGEQRLQFGYAIEEVVAEYGALRACLFNALEAAGFVVVGECRLIIDAALDEAIGLAVCTFAEERQRDIDERRREHLTFVAHDLRTPLNAISLATSGIDRARSRSDRAPEMVRFIDTLRRNVEVLQELVANVLREENSVDVEFGAMPAVVPRSIDLWALVEGLACEMAELASKSGVRILNEVPDGFFVHADAGLLRRIFQNLLSNAVRYAPDGTVRIGARRAEESTVLIVTDDGRGIPSDRLTKVFDKFEGDSNDPASLGLGLAFVKSAVEAHGGTVSIESTPDTGTTFVATLPDKRNS